MCVLSLELVFAIPIPAPKQHNAAKISMELIAKEVDC